MTMQTRKELEESLVQGIITQKEFDEQVRKLEQRESAIARPVSQEEKEDEPNSQGKDEPSGGSDKTLLWAIAIIAIIIVAFVGMRFLFSTGPVTLSELNEQNYAGELEPDEGYLYNGHSIVFADGSWFAQVAIPNTTTEITIPFRYGPRDVDKIPVSGVLNATFDDAALVYMTFDPTAGNFTQIALAIGELKQNFAVAFGKQTKGACDRNETSACEGVPVVTCEDADKAVVSFELSSSPSVALMGNCMVVSGQGDGFVKGVDRMLLEWYGVIG